MKRIQRGPVRGISLKLQVRSRFLGCSSCAAVHGNAAVTISAMHTAADSAPLVLQEEERERRMDYVPEESAVNTETIEVGWQSHAP
jgi:hypothetical protein